LGVVAKGISIMIMSTSTIMSSLFVQRNFFVIRHSCFVIFHFCPLI